MPYQCNDCDRSFSLKSDLMSHTESHLGNKTIENNHVQKAPSNRNSLISQPRAYAGNKITWAPLSPHQCSYCDKTFRNNYKLKTHLRRHTGEKPYQCSYCEKTFSVKCNLKVHLEIHTRECLYQCSQCEMNFTRDWFIQRHLVLQHGERSYQCSKCDKSFKYNSHLKRHQKFHGIQEKSYQCQECSKSFSDKTLLVRHLIVHTGEKPYQCSQCIKSFSLKSNLKRHIRIHSGDKPYQCRYCVQQFTLSRQYKKHLTTHTVTKENNLQYNNGDEFSTEKNYSEYIKPKVEIKGDKVYSESIDINDLCESKFEIKEELIDPVLITLIGTELATSEAAR